MNTLVKLFGHSLPLLILVTNLLWIVPVALFLTLRSF